MSLKIYLPQLLLERLHYRIDDIPPYKTVDNELESFDYKIDVFYWLLYILVNPKGCSLKEKDINGFSFIPLSSEYLKKNIGNDYINYLRYLINQGFILPKNNYSINQCKYFHLYNCTHINNSNSLYSFTKKINNTYQSPVNIRVITNSKNRKEFNYVEITFSKYSKIYSNKKKSYELQLGRIRKSPHHIKTMWNHFKSNMVFDNCEAERYCSKFLNKNMEEIERRLQNNEINDDTAVKAKNILLNKYINRIATVNNLKNPKKNKSWLFSRKGTNRRLNTNLTMMASDLRRFIKGYNNLSYLDLSNSQPVLFNAILKRYEENASKTLKIQIEQYYNSTINGKWYEDLSKVFNCSRDEAKQKWMLIAYSKNNQCLEIKNEFKKRYPEIYNIIHNIKKENYREFSISLQKSESKIFIDEICKELIEQGIQPFSIHDGVIVPKTKKEETYQIMIKVLYKHLGGIPVVDIDGVKRYPKIAC